MTIARGPIVVYDPTLGLTSIYPRTGAVHKRRRRVCGTVKRGLRALPCMHRDKALTPDEALIMIRTAKRGADASFGLIHRCITAPRTITGQDA